MVASFYVAILAQPWDGYMLSTWHPSSGRHIGLWWHGHHFRHVPGAFIIGAIEAATVAVGLTGFWTQLIYGLIIVLSVIMHTYCTGARINWARRRQSARFPICQTPLSWYCLPANTGATNNYCLAKQMGLIPW